MALDHAKLYHARQRRLTRKDPAHGLHTTVSYRDGDTFALATMQGLINDNVTFSVRLRCEDFSTCAGVVMDCGTSIYGFGIAIVPTTGNVIVAAGAGSTSSSCAPGGTSGVPFFTATGQEYTLTCSIKLGTPGEMVLWKDGVRLAQDQASSGLTAWALADSGTIGIVAGSVAGGWISGGAAVNLTDVSITEPLRFCSRQLPIRDGYILES